jgi:hypothetical protein
MKCRSVTLRLEHRLKITENSLPRRMFGHTRSHNKVRELANVCLPWQQWTETSVWFDDVGISAFQSCVVVDL